MLAILKGIVIKITEQIKQIEKKIIYEYQ